MEKKATMKKKLVAHARAPRAAAARHRSRLAASRGRRQRQHVDVGAQCQHEALVARHDRCIVSCIVVSSEHERAFTSSISTAANRAGAPDS